MCKALLVTVAAFRSSKIRASTRDIITGGVSAIEATTVNYSAVARWLKQPWPRRCGYPLSSLHVPFAITVTSASDFLFLANSRQMCSAQPLPLLTSHHAVKVESPALHPTDPRLQRLVPQLKYVVRFFLLSALFECSFILLFWQVVLLVDL